MASTEFDALVKSLRDNPPLAGNDILEMRAGMDAITGNIPLVPGIEIERIKIGACDAEWTVPDGIGRERVMLYFHGGGYAIGSIESHRNLVAGIAIAGGFAGLNLGYRLAPEDPHPAAVDDAIAAYRYLLDSGIAPERIAFAGDSAGGGLTAAALLATRDRGLPMPGAGALLSPWLDLTQSGDSMLALADVDPLVGKENLDLMAAAYVGAGDPKTPLISPLFADLEGLPPLLIQVGSAETLLDDSERFAARARAAGVEVTLEVWDEMIHVWHAFSLVLPEAREATKQIGEVLAKRLA
jgi:monoterpene epsilon-lactone hydrolase